MAQSQHRFVKDLIVHARDKVAKARPGGFEKGDVMRELRRNPKLGAALRDINDRYNSDWGLGDLLLRQLNAMIGEALGARDENRIRIFECYSVPGKRERRWLPLRAMTKGMLLNVMRETRVLERQLHVKGEGYEFFMEELDQVKGEATIEDVYDQAAPKIVAYRNREAA